MAIAFDATLGKHIRVEDGGPGSGKRGHTTSHPTGGAFTPEHLGSTPKSKMNPAARSWAVAHSKASSSGAKERYAKYWAQAMNGTSSTHAAERSFEPGQSAGHSVNMK